MSGKRLACLVDQTLSARGICASCCLPALSLGQILHRPKKLPAGPAAPQSTHYPFSPCLGKRSTWSLRIGLKGPNGWIAGYPPILWNRRKVTHEAGADALTYHAKDSATGAIVVVHLTRERVPTPQRYADSRAARLGKYPSAPLSITRKSAL